MEVITSSVINCSFWYGAVGSHPSFCVQQEFDYAINYVARISTVSITTKYHSTKIDSFGKGLNKNLFSEAGSKLHNSLPCPQSQLSKQQTKFCNGVETGVLLATFAQKLRRISANVPELNFSSHSTWSYRRFSISGSESKYQRQRKLSSSHEKNSLSCKNLTHRVMLLKDLYPI